MTSGTLPPLWTCPKCGVQLVSKNLSHSCVVGCTLEDLFAKSEPHVAELFDRFEELVRECGPVTRIVQKTRATFMVRMRFVSIYPRKNHLLIGFVFKRRVEHPRFAKIEKLGSSYVNSLKIEKEFELDQAVRVWLKESYAVGEQRYLLEAA